MRPDLEMVRAVFRAEATELLAGMEQTFLSIETSAGSEVFERLFRSIHTLKGNALLMGFPAASELAHTVEDLIEKLSARAVPRTAALATLLLQAVDALRLLIGIPNVNERAGVDPGEIQRRLVAAARAGGPPEAASPASSAPAVEGEAPAAERLTEAVPAPARERTLRVGLDRLDRMLDLTGEIAIARGRLTTMLEQPGRYSPQELLAAHRESDRLYQDLQELVMKARLVPIGSAFQPFARTLRDLSTATGKLVRLELSGEEVEVDTAVVELIRDPLTHLVRNAVDHGIEPPQVRKARGKNPMGTLRLHARHEAGGILVEVSDDGAGLDPGRIRDRARAMGLLGPTEERPDDELYQFIFTPGFSTAERLTELSGRGIGLDVVRSNIEALRGAISIDTQAGRGTTLTLRLPLTLSIIEGFLVGVGEETYVLPLESVIECVDLPPTERQPGRSGVLNLRGQPLPFLRLRDHFAMEGPPAERESVVIVGYGQGHQAGFAVDALLGQTQTVIKPLGRLFQHLPGVSGSAILGNGRVALVLDVSTLLRKLLVAPGPTAAA
ncbi:chemotaxis protein CheA [Hyalangium rubrum]|uniref:Chemotaxis protein CheA n=1 Tax=Hyalangium rubrum TaxID=3103134 RepID=A0ABU5H635_9BACT|nr:chemotaxis protein CheW [Hyalangium sp. s54d21]MDY7228298.1 chemotaxis protein CheW [Hyalangium sp. s54d21]